MSPVFRSRRSVPQVFLFELPCDRPRGIEPLLDGAHAVCSHGKYHGRAGGTPAVIHLGVGERTDKLVRELVLADPAPFVPLTTKKRGKEINYEAKAVMLAGRRYIVCRNQPEAE